MRVYLVFLAIFSFSSNYAVSASLQDGDSSMDIIKPSRSNDDEIKARLAALESSLAKVLDKNDRLEKRVSVLETENKELKTALEELRGPKVSEIPEQSASSETIHKSQNKIIPGRPGFEFSKGNSENRRQVTISTIAFTAVVSPSYITLGRGKTVVYDNVVSNVGGAYDHTTGVFTAPVSGVYAFDFAEMIDPGHNEYFELVKDGSHVIWNYGHATGASHLVSSSRMATVELNKGNQVWVRTEDAGHHGTGRIHGNGFTTFSGWIIAYTE